jgi:hypothetical protein
MLADGARGPRPSSPAVVVFEQQLQIARRRKRHGLLGEDCAVGTFFATRYSYDNN